MTVIPLLSLYTSPPSKAEATKRMVREGGIRKQQPHAFFISPQHVCTHTCACICPRTRAFIHMHTHKHIFPCAPMHTCVHTHVRTTMRCVHTLAHNHTCACLHTYTQTMCTRAHMYVCCIHAYTRATCVHRPVHIHTNTPMHTCIHLCTHSPSHTGSWEM